MRNIFLLTIIVMIVSSCGAAPPWQRWMFEGPPPGQEYTPLYVEGWKDGCHTGASASVNHWYKFQYKFKQDSIKAQNKVYYKGWKDAFDYCQRYLHQWKTRKLL